MIIDQDYRSKGLSKQLMDIIKDHEALKAVHHFELYCLPKMIPFYEKYGFTNEVGEVQ